MQIQIGGHIFMSHILVWRSLHVPRSDSAHGFERSLETM